MGAKMNQRRLTLCPFIPGRPAVPGNPRAPWRKKKRKIGPLENTAVDTAPSEAQIQQSRRPAILSCSPEVQEAHAHQDDQAFQLHPEGWRKGLSASDTSVEGLNLLGIVEGQM